MALDVLTTITATTYAKQGGVVTGVTRRGLYETVSSPSGISKQRFQVTPAATITSIASGLNTRFDDITYYG